MADSLERVIDIAKKLRKVAKKVEDADVQSLIVDLNLCVADLKLQLVEQQEEQLRHRHSEGTAQKPAGPEPARTDPAYVVTAHPLSPSSPHQEP